MSGRVQEKRVQMIRKIYDDLIKFDLRVFRTSLINLMKTGYSAFCDFFSHVNLLSLRCIFTP